MGKELVAQCKWLEDNIDSNGPYFMGEQFSLVARHHPPPCATNPLLCSADIPYVAVLSGTMSSQADIAGMQGSLTLNISGLLIGIS